MDPAQIGLLIGIISAVVGLIYGALRFGRDETKKQIETSGSIVDQFQKVNDELRQALADCTKAREDLERAALASREACNSAMALSRKLEAELADKIADNTRQEAEHDG